METQHDLKVKPHLRPDYNAIHKDKKEIAGIRGFKEEIQPQSLAGIRGYSETPTKSPLVASTSKLLELHPKLLPQSHTKAISAYEDILKIS